MKIHTFLFFRIMSSIKIMYTTAFKQADLYTGDIIIWQPEVWKRQV